MTRSNNKRNLDNRFNLKCGHDNAGRGLESRQSKLNPHKHNRKSIECLKLKTHTTV